MTTKRELLESITLKLNELSQEVKRVNKINAAELTKFRRDEIAKLRADLLVPTSNIQVVSLKDDHMQVLQVVAIRQDTSSHELVIEVI